MFTFPNISLTLVAVLKGDILIKKKAQFGNSQVMRFFYSEDPKSKLRIEGKTNFAD